jgi:serine/threonine-protein kinase RsbW
MSCEVPEGTIRYQLMAPARPESVDLVHDVIAQLWTHEPAPGSADRIRFEMAVIEILGNIIEHAALVDPPDVSPRQFNLVVECDDDRIEARFGDDGQPAEIDLERVAMPGADAEDGRGLAMASAAVDELAYERIGPVNHWRLVCRRQP